jgi:hypothetical protein
MTRARLGCEQMVIGQVGQSLFVMLGRHPAEANAVGFSLAVRVGERELQGLDQNQLKVFARNMVGCVR